MPFVPDQPIVGSVSQAPSARPESSFLGNLIRGVTNPFISTGKNILGAGYEVGRLGAGKLGVKRGQASENPFLSMKDLERFTPQARPMSLDKGSALEKQLRDSLSVSSYAVPFGRGANVLTKGVIPGAGVGAMQAAAQEDATPGSVALSAGFGGLTGGVLQKLIGGRAPKKAGKVSRAGRRIRKGVLKPKVKTGPRAFAQEEELLTKAGKLGLKGSAQQQRQQSSQMIDDLYKELSATIKTAKVKGRPVTASSLRNKIKSAIGNEIVVETPAQQRLIDNILKKVVPDQKGSLTPQQIGDIARKISSDPTSKVSAAFKKLRAGGTITEADQAWLSAYRVTNDLMKSKIPATRGVLGRMETLHQIAPGLEKSAEQAGIRVPLAGKIKTDWPQQGKEILGTTLEKIGAEKSGAPGASPFLQQLLGQAGAQTTSRLLVPEQVDDPGKEDQGDISAIEDSQSDDIQGQQLKSEVDHADIIPEQQENRITLDQLQAVLMHPSLSKQAKSMVLDVFELQKKYGGTTDIQSVGAFVDQIEAGRMGISSVPTDLRAQVVVEMSRRPPSSEEIQTYKSLVTQIDTLDELLTEKRFAGIVPLAPRKAEIDTTRNLLGMQVARLYEKGRMSDQDRAFYLSLLPTAEIAAANPAFAKAQLQSLRESLTAKFGQ